jgi:hypothetical protein
VNESEARLILQSCQPGIPGDEDAQIAEALRFVAANPELVRWWDEEQAVDRAIEAKLRSLPEPFGLKTRILAQQIAPRRRLSARWVFGLAAACALLLIGAQIAGLWHPKAKAHFAADYAREMTSFIRLSPPLEMESDNLGEIQNWLAQKDVETLSVPVRLAALRPVGCRVLSFRGHDVTLICFVREGNRLAHLFTVDRSALPEMKPGGKPLFANENGWMTATWVEGDRVYMVAMQGGRAALEEYLPHA